MRSMKIEYAILKTILSDPEPDGYPFTLPDLCNLIAQSVRDPEPSFHEVVDTIERLWQGEIVVPLKWNDAAGRFEPYEGSGDRDQGFFSKGDFRLKETPHTRPYFEELENKVGPEPKKGKIGFPVGGTDS